MLRVAVIILVMSSLSYPTPADADDGRSVAWAYGIGAAGVLIPAWVGLAVLPKNDEELSWNPRSIAAMTGMYASLAWGTSAGYLYSGNTRYALVGGLGKTALLGAGLVAHRAFESKDGHHPYLLASTVMLLTLWSATDYILLYRDVRRQNERRVVSASIPIAGLGMLPSISVSDSALELGLGGRF